MNSSGIGNEEVELLLTVFLVGNFQITSIVGPFLNMVIAGLYSRQHTAQWVANPPFCMSWL